MGRVVYPGVAGMGCGVWVLGGLGGGEGDVVAEGLELADEVSGALGGVGAGEVVVGAKVVEDGGVGGVG